MTMNSCVSRMPKFSDVIFGMGIDHPRLKCRFIAASPRVISEFKSDVFGTTKVVPFQRQLEKSASLSICKLLAG